NIMNDYSSLRYLINQEKGSKANISSFKKIWCLLRGFSSAKYELYNFYENNYKDYLSDFNRQRTAKINGSYSLIINDKKLFSRVFNENNMTAKVYGAIRNGQIWLNNNKVSFEAFLEFLSEKKLIII